MVTGVFFVGSYAIVNAGTFAEYCVDSDPATPCAFPANASSLNVAGSIDTYAGSQYPYWLAGACGAAVMCSLFATFALCVSVELLKESQLERFKKNKGQYELKALYVSHWYYRGKKRVESLRDFHMICHFHSVTECLHSGT